MHKFARPLLLCFALLVIAVFLSIGVGSVAIPPKEVLEVFRNTFGGTVPASDRTRTYQTILLTLRMPRTILMMMTGAALAGSGCAYQGLFRNPLADPYLIGAASGAGLGAYCSCFTTR